MSDFYAFRVRDRSTGEDILILSHNEVEEYRKIKDALEDDEFSDGSVLEITIVCWNLEDMKKHLMMEDMKEIRQGEFSPLEDVPPQERDEGEVPLTHDEHKKSIHRREE